MHMISRADYLQERESGENMADLMRAKDILDAIKRNKERVAPAEEDSGVITGYRMAHDHITEIIIRCIPTVDAVPVVRCRDCRFWHNDGIMTTCDRMIGNGYEANFFCANAERKDNGNT